MIYGEHRYYGESFPYANQTKAFEKENLKFLSVEQTMRDYVNLLTFWKGSNPGFETAPVIVAGGSYGGMLAAWLRLKYPLIFHGALASSAPILWFKGKINPSAYTDHASTIMKRKDFGGNNNLCFKRIHDGFYDLTVLSQDPDQYNDL